MSKQLSSTYWPSASHFAEAIQCPGICFSNPLLRQTLPAIDRLGMPLVTSGQFAYVYKLKPPTGGAYAVRCFRGYLGDREQRYQAIDEHLRTYRIPALASFAYESEGILVRGHRYPILFMEWIEGPTLDVYLEEMVTRREVLLHLSEEWLKLVKALSDTGIVHGDLQHGNIIVEHGNLRLVDLDGMFVPAMTGWTASELGHQHYQHPRRDMQLFDPSLDNFSALVIYLSFISLAERPELWTEHHDENLLFTRADFLEPESSALFEKIKSIGPEQRRLAEALESAAKGDPATVPSLLSLVNAKSRLPFWMVAPQDLESTERTREVPRPDEEYPVIEQPQWSPWESKRQNAIPVTPESFTVQSIFSGTQPLFPAAAQQQQLAAPDPRQVARNTAKYAREFLKKSAYAWYLGIYLSIQMLGLEYVYIVVGIAMALIVCLMYGFVRAVQDAQNANVFDLSAVTSLNISASKQHKPLASGGQAPNVTPAPASAAAQIIANRALSIYHLPTCNWVAHISNRNLVEFNTAVEAVAAGYRPCRVCNP